MTTVTMSKKGWIVIPKEIRNRLGLEPGDKVSLVEYGDVVALMSTPKDPISELAGKFKDGPSLTQALLEDRKEELEREERKIGRWS